MFKIIARQYQNHESANKGINLVFTSFHGSFPDPLKAELTARELNRYEKKKRSGVRYEPVDRTPKKYTHKEIRTVQQLKETLRNGERAWPGGDQMYFVASYREALSFDGMRQTFREAIEHIKDCEQYGNIPYQVEINYEDEFLTCHVTEKQIPASYL